MANAYGLSVSSLTLSSLNITVTGRTGSNLSSTEIVLKKFNSGTSVFDIILSTDYSISNATATTAKITPNTAFTQTDLLLIQIVDGANKSDRVSIDFAEDYTGNDANYNYQMPDETGTYTLNLSSVNGDDFSATASSTTFTVGPAPTTGYSSISISKPYLVKYTGAIYPVTIVLNNSTGSASQASYEVIFKATKTN